MNLKKSLLLIALILFVDQFTKIYVKLNFTYQEQIQVFSWFKILFIENEGAAWGTKLSDFLPVSKTTGKLILTIFRILAVFGIGYWLYDSIKNKLPKTLILAVSLIFAGAVGNILDSVFYGVLFNESTRDSVATIFSDDPYGTVFYGKVVDMLHFPFIEDAIWPSWVPYFGGKSFSFFEPVFNIADMAISSGVGVLIFFNKKAFPKLEEEVSLEDAPLEEGESAIVAPDATEN